MRVNATDVDSELNSIIKYSIKNPTAGFTIGESTGIIYANTSRIQKPMRNDIQLTIMAKDSGIFQRSSTTTVRVHINTNSHIKPQFLQNQYRATTNENAPIGTVVCKLLSAESAIEYPEIFNSVFFEIISGDEDGTFEISYPGSSLILIKSLDREKTDYYHLRILLLEPGMSSMRKEDNSSIISVFLTVEDFNDHSPIFQENNYIIEISEATPLKQTLTKIIALDADQQNTPNSEVVYDITSGNDEGIFTIDLVSGVLSVNNILNYDTGSSNFNLVIRACDSSLHQPKCNLQPLVIKLLDENDHEPVFPVSEYLEFVGENEPLGVSIFTARATDLDRGDFGKLNYTIISASSSYSELEDSWKMFKVDAITGIITTHAVFDYEQRSRYTFILRATDVGGKSTGVKVKIMIDSRDEFSPQFTERTYRFVMSAARSLSVGHIVGHVTATDRDRGPDGRVIYQLSTQHPYFKINRTTGAVIIKKKLDNAVSMLGASRDISLVVTASSGRQASLTNMTVVEIVFDPLADSGANLASNMNSGSESSGLASWALGLLITLLLAILCFAAVFLFMHMKNRRHKHVSKPNLSGDTVGSSNSYVDPSAFDTIPIRGGSSGNNNGQFAPPKYDEIPPYGPHASSNSGAATTSELSGGSEQSSGREYKNNINQ